MGGWETVLAALGGFLVGFALKSLLGASAQRARDERLRHAEAKARVAVVPVLERRADALGIPRRALESQDSLGQALELASAIQHFEETHNLGFSDTVEMSRGDLDLRAKTRS